MSKWLISGAAGFLGSHLVEQLVAHQIPVVAVDNLSAGRLQFLSPFTNHPRFKFACVDVRDEAAIAQLIVEETPSVVVHLAALHFIPAAVRNPGLAFDLNVDGTRSILCACRHTAVQRFWFASTADVYKPSEKPHQESSDIGPFNVYGVTKWMGEDLVRSEAKSYPERHFMIGRLFNLYGTRDPSPHVLPEIISQLRASSSNVLRLGNVTPSRDLVPVVDAARAVIETVNRSVPGVMVLNIASGISLSIEELVERISLVLGRTLTIEVDPDKVRSVERPFLRADIQALKSLLGWTPHSNILQGLHELLNLEGIPCLDYTSASSRLTSGWGESPTPTT
jgi:UDP-glucose 4-epimerase